MFGLAVRWTHALPAKAEGVSMASRVRKEGGTPADHLGVTKGRLVEQHLDYPRLETTDSFTRLGILT